jgi:hypothetical protein
VVITLVIEGVWGRGNRRPVMRRGGRGTASAAGGRQAGEEVEAKWKDEWSDQQHNVVRRGRSIGKSIYLPQLHIFYPSTVKPGY